MTAQPPDLATVAHALGTSIQDNIAIHRAVNEAINDLNRTVDRLERTIVTLEKRIRKLEGFHGA